MIDRISSETRLLNLDWHIISLLVEVEKFSSDWSAKQIGSDNRLNAFRLHEYRPSHKIVEAIVDTLSGSTEQNKVQALVNFNDLLYWFEAEAEIPTLIRCLLFRYFMHFVCPGNDLFLVIGSELSKSLLIESGYSWLNYIMLSFPIPEKMHGWLPDVLSDIRDAQQTLMYKLEIYGPAAKLTVTEQLLIHIIEHHKGIGTRFIAKKLGKSEATVKRMLAKLRRLNLVESMGKGRGVCHKLVLYH